MGYSWSLEKQKEEMKTIFVVYFSTILFAAVWYVAQAQSRLELTHINLQYQIDDLWAKFILHEEETYLNVSNLGLRLEKLEQNPR